MRAGPPVKLDNVHPRRPKLPAWLTAADPGRTRFINASMVALGVAISASIAWSIVHFAHVDSSLVGMGAFMAMQLGFLVRDTTARDRVITTLLLIVPILASLTIATALSGSRTLEIIVFIAVAGAAMWVRRFGTRAGSLGTMAFFAYFFALFLRPTWHDLPWFFLVAVCATGSLALVRAFTVRSNPRRQLSRLIAELRAASASAVQAAPAGEPVLHTRLVAIDQIGTAITAWQSEYSTRAVIGLDRTDFARLVLNARVDLDHACREVAGAKLPDAPDALLDDLRIVLGSHSTPSEISAAEARAAARLADGSDQYAPWPVLAQRITDRATLSHAALATVDLSHAPINKPSTSNDAPAAPPSSTPTEGAASSPSAPPKPAPQARRPWDHWQLTTRMAIQAMVATALATVVGELISASRWYWAVLTAFIVFLGTNNRGAILTRASRRLVGTLSGVLVGFGLALLINGNLPLLIIACVLTVFCMLYFGPLQYAVQAFFITVFLALMYGLLGILTRQLLELRLEETALGAVIGVACAYLIFSSSSRPSIMKQLTEHFDALDDALTSTKAALCGSGDEAALVGGVHRVQASCDAVHTALAAMSMSLLTGRRTLNAELAHLMDTDTRLVGQLGRAAIDVVNSNLKPDDDDQAARLGSAVDQVLRSSRAARSALVDGDCQPVDIDEPAVIDSVGPLRDRVPSPRIDAVDALSRLNWVLLRAVDARARA